MAHKILVVEDEPIIAEDLSLMLKKEGYQIIGIANDGSSALDLLHSQNPDIALLDISLDSSLSGFDIAKVINEKYKIPFIFITSFSDKYTLEKAKDALNRKGYFDLFTNTHSPYVKAEKVVLAW